MKYSYIYLIILTVCILPMHVYALAPMADSFYAYQKWIFPAYLYNLIFGAVSLVGLTSVFCIWKKTVGETVRRLCDYLELHPSIAVVILGLLLAIPFGLLTGILYQLLWFTSIPLCLAIITIFPVLLICKRLRNKLLHHCKFMTVLIVIAVSSLCASLFFMIFTELGWMNNKMDYLIQFRANYEILTHPLDSLKTIWGDTFFFFFEILFCLLLLWIGKGLRELRGWFRDDVLKGLINNRTQRCKNQDGESIEGA